MLQHPTKSDLESFLLGKLTKSERKAVLAHLLRGCAKCRSALAPLAQAFFEPPPAEAPDDGWRYDFVVRRAIRRAFRESSNASAPEPLAPGRLLPMPRPDWHGDLEQLKRCEAALAETRKLGRSDPQAMLALAIANATLAEHLDPAAFPPGAVYDLQARAYAELGNARRITSDFPSAGVDFIRAVARAGEGTKDPLLVAETLWMAASLYRATRHFGEAFRLLDRAYAVYRQVGDDHLAGRTLISMGIAKAARGSLLEATNLLQAGVRSVDGDRDPALLLAGIHNLIWVWVERAQFSKGRALIRRHSDLYSRYGGRFDLLRLRWCQGRIAAGMGEPEEAEAALLEARSGFAEHRLGYVEALISFDLAILWQRLGRKREARMLTEEILGTFRTLGIRREALAVQMLAKRRTPPRRLTPSLLRLAAARLERLDRNAKS